MTDAAPGDVRRRTGLVTAALLIGLFTTTFPATILTIAVQPIAEDLHSLPSTVVWVTTAPLLAAAVTTPLLGRLGDLFGHRRLYVTGIAVALVFAMGSALAWSAPVLIATRTITQVGAAATFPAAIALLFRVLPPGDRVRGTSWVGATASTATVVGVVVGGPLIDLVGWRVIFYAQAGLCLAALVFALSVLPADPPDRKRAVLDVPGAALLAVATFALTFGVNRLAVWGWSPVPIACLAIVPFATWALVVAERRAAAPLLPVRVLSSHNVRVIAGGSLLLGAGYMGNFVITPLFMQSVLGLTAAATSLLSVPRAACSALGSFTAHRASSRFGLRRMILGAITVLTLVLATMAVGALTVSVVLIAVMLPFSGLAFGQLNTGLLAAQGAAVDERDVGLATSLQQTGFQVGGVIGVGLFTALAGDATTEGPFALVFLLTASCVLLASLTLLRMHEVREPSRATVHAVPTDADAAPW
ncbi:MFS transporter [Blastococcus sp. URHD0036]|uniref:MFS transporter n=1 Tax=Blastococcus sp. URHD0036 TaxID=1380356 RepID=UPI00068C6C7C|nr:MFS transporter [Blastococcus sp. URHD0036]